MVPRREPGTIKYSLNLPSFHHLIPLSLQGYQQTQSSSSSFPRQSCIHSQHLLDFFPFAFFLNCSNYPFSFFFLYVCGSHTCVYAHMCVSGWRPEVHIRCLWLSPDLYDSIVSLDSLPQGSCVCLLGAGIADTLPHPSSLYVGLRIQTTILMLLGPNCSFFLKAIFSWCFFQKIHLNFLKVNRA